MGTAAAAMVQSCICSGPSRRTSLTGVSKDLPDGYLYGTIRNGGIAMPSYADAMSAHERWQVVTFVRSLQHPGVASK